MGLKCIDFVGYIESPLGRTTVMRFKAKYVRSDPEISKIKIEIYIEGSLVFEKEYDAADELYIDETFEVAWGWGSAACIHYTGSFTAPSLAYSVVYAVGRGYTAGVYGPSGSCIAAPMVGEVEGMVVTADEAVYVDAANGGLADCGGALDEGSARATVVLYECNNGCTETRYPLVLYSVGYRLPTPGLRLHSIPVVPLS